MLNTNQSLQEMKIIINDRRKIFAVQKEFSQIFPYLKLEFYAKPHQSVGASSQKIMQHPAKKIGECRTTHQSGNITITPNMMVLDLEQSFSDVYGLTVRILRKSGKTWLKTTVTGRWTLEAQNQQGEELSNPNNII